MTKTEEVENKLTKLRADFRQKLPAKMDEIKNIWQELNKNINAESLKQLHLKVHSLHGSAATYGYSELSKIAASVEKILKPILGSPESISHHKATINKLIDSLHTALSEKDEPSHPVKNVKKPVEQDKTLLILDDVKGWESENTLQITTFGYQVQRHENVDTFLDKITEKIPAVIIINHDLLNQKLKDFLMTNLEKEESRIPIVFISTDGDFSSRLSAIKLGGDAYFIKPFLLNELITRIDALTRPDSDPYRVLIVDDENDVADYYSTILEQASMKTSFITKSSDIDRALHEFNPDMVLIDIQMPVCNGLELAKMIRQQDLYQSMPIVYLSAEEDQLMQLNAMKIGADGFVTKSMEPDYLIMLIKNKIERYRKLQSLMLQDNLTGLYDHTFIQRLLEIKLMEAKQNHLPLNVALIDLDKCKSINETYGHQAGDHVLKSLALMIKKRAKDNEHVGRYNGEKFLIILPNSSIEAAKDKIDDLRKQFVSLHFYKDQQMYNATFSAGIASFPEFHSVSELLEAVSEALAQSKKSGRNRVEVAG